MTWRRKIAKPFAVLLLVLMLMFATAIHAGTDMGPKPSITVNVVNAPEDNYVIDLLMYGRGYTMEDSELERYSGKEREMLVTLITYEDDDGMTARIGNALGTEFAWSKKGETYRFSYSSVPDVFGVILVNETGTVTLSQVCHRKAYNAVVTFDGGNGALHEDVFGFYAAHILRFTVTLLSTLLTEGIIFLLFKYKFREGKNGRVFLLTNFCTQLGLYIMLNLLGGLMLLAEILIVAIEAFVYSHLLTPNEPKRADEYAITANIVSAVIGIPVWTIVYFII